MLRKARKAAVMVLLLCAGFVACRRQDSQDLFKEQSDNLEITQAPSSSPQVTDVAGRESFTEGAYAQTTIEPADQSDTPVGGDKSDTSYNLPDGGMEDIMEAEGQDLSKEFYYEELSDDVIARINGKSYKDNCDVPYEELRYVKTLYWGFDQKTHKGEMIVNKLIAEDTVEILKELYEVKYPIERMVLVDEYDADDNASMAADNSSSFNYRNVDGTDHISLHSYGLAIDINPLYNPYVRTIKNKTVILPDNGTEYADRTLDCEYYIDTEDACYKAFIKHGFTWGGDWKNSKDYQHFQKNTQ